MQQLIEVKINEQSLIATAKLLVTHNPGPWIGHTEIDKDKWKQMSFVERHQIVVNDLHKQALQAAEEMLATNSLIGGHDTAGYSLNCWVQAGYIQVYFYFDANVAFWDKKYKVSVPNTQNFVKTRIIGGILSSTLEELTQHMVDNRHFLIHQVVNNNLVKQTGYQELVKNDAINMAWDHLAENHSMILAGNTPVPVHHRGMVLYKQILLMKPGVQLMLFSSTPLLDQIDLIDVKSIVFFGSED